MKLIPTDRDLTLRHPLSFELLNMYTIYTISEKFENLSEQINRTVNSRMYQNTHKDMRILTKT